MAIKGLKGGGGRCKKGLLDKPAHRGIGINDLALPIKRM